MWGRRKEIEGLFPTFKEFIIQVGSKRTNYLIVSNQVVGSCEKEWHLILRLGQVGLEEINTYFYIADKENRASSER